MAKYSFTSGQICVPIQVSANSRKKILFCIFALQISVFKYAMQIAKVHFKRNL